MDNYVKVYSETKGVSDKMIDFIVSAGYSVISQTPHHVKRTYGEDNYLIIYLKRGKMILYEDNSTTTLEEGSVILFPPYRLQKYDFLHEPVNENYWVHFTGCGGILRELNFFSDKTQVYHVGSNEKICSLWKNMINELQLNMYASGLQANTDFVEILTAISRLIYRINDPRSSMVYSRLTPAIVQMHADYKENRPNDYYAKVCNMSESSFYHLFRKAFNTTPTDYVNEIRLKVAENLLKETDYSLENISYLTGFQSPQYFSKIFRQKRGITPLKYRNADR